MQPRCIIILGSILQFWGKKKKLRTKHLRNIVELLNTWLKDSCGGGCCGDGGGGDGGGCCGGGDGGDGGGRVVSWSLDMSRFWETLGTISVPWQVQGFKVK